MTRRTKRGLDGGEQIRRAAQADEEAARVATQLAAGARKSRQEQTMTRRTKALTTSKAKAKTTGKAKGTSTGDGTGVCLCGCGGATKSRFVPGHDAKLKSILLRAARSGGLSPEQQDLVARLGWARLLPAADASPGDKA
jgi:hypothetical protein